MHTFAAMVFYRSISEYYDLIFPYNPLQLDFVKDRVPDLQKKRILDVGCGTGNLCINLAPFCKDAIGVDPDKNMLKIARSKVEEGVDNLNFYPHGMTDIKSNYSHVDAILCLGNTLVHLGSNDEILEFLVQAKKVLKPGGKLLVQIINYDRIFKDSITSLPTIENDSVKFVRNYEYNVDNHKIEFETILRIKDIDDLVRNLIELHPVRKEELEELLVKAGFGSVQFFGNFRRDALTPRSIPLVFEAVS